MNTLKIQIPSLSENIKIVESFIDNTKEKYRLDDDIYGNIMIAVTESVNNAIIHGNKQDKNKNVQLELHFDENRVIFLIEDEGNGFNFENLNDPTSPENLKKAGGRGIYIIKSLCDEVTFHNNGKKIELSFYLTSY